MPVGLSRLEPQIWKLQRTTTGLGLWAEPAWGCVRAVPLWDTIQGEAIQTVLALLVVCPLRRLAHTKQPARSHRPTRALPSAGSHQLQLVLRLLDIPTEIEFGPRKPNNPIEASFHFRRQIASSHEALGFLANRVQRLHEVSLLQLTGIVWHNRSESRFDYLVDAVFSRSTNLASSFPICRSHTMSSGILSGGRTAFESVKTRVILMTRPSCTYSDR
jgi:hypothetical protein